MRNFRKAALAGATAVALAFGSASGATAAETQVVTNTKGEGGSSTNLGHSLEVWEKDEAGNTVKTGADGQALFGSSKENGGFEAQPLWAQLFYVTTIFTSVSAIVGLIVGPAYNFFVHGPFAA